MKLCCLIHPYLYCIDCKYKMCEDCYSKTKGDIRSIHYKVTGCTSSKIFIKGSYNEELKYKGLL